MLVSGEPMIGRSSLDQQVTVAVWRLSTRAEIYSRSIRCKGQRLHRARSACRIRIDQNSSVRAVLNEIPLCKVNSFSDETAYFRLREVNSQTPKKSV